MTIQQTTSSAQQKRLDAFSLDADQAQNSSCGLHAAFQKDCISKKATTVLPVPAKDQTPSFWSKFSSWFFQTAPNNADSLQSPPQADARKSVLPVNARPVLEEPENMPVELKEATLPPVTKKKNSRQTFTHAQALEAVNLMSQQTMEEVMCIILKGQIELEKENALVAENTFDVYQKMKKLQHKVLEEIKETLMKDEKVLGYCQTAKNVAMVTTVVCGLIASIVSVGWLAPIAAGCFAALTTGSAAYMQKRTNEDQANLEQYNHGDRTLAMRIEDSQETLMKAAEMDQLCKERLIQFVKRLSKMNQLVMQK